MPAADGPVAVTGAAGYVGGRLVESLGERARGIVRAPVPWMPARRQHVCDLLGDKGDVARAVEGARAIVHLAGHNEVVAAQDPDRAARETVAMTEAVTEAARSTGIQRIVYVSTVHVYGDRLRPGAVVDEDVSPAPTSSYAQTRHDCEEVLTSSPALDPVVLRLTNAVGAPAHPSIQRWTLVASDLSRRAVLDRRVVLRSSGLQWRDFIALGDAVGATVAAADPAAVPAGVFNLASGRPVTVRALAELVQDRVEAACGWRPALEAPTVTGEPEAPYTVSSNRLTELGILAARPLSDAVDDLVAHCRRHETALREDLER